AARLRIDQQQADAGYLVGIAHEEAAADVLAVDLADPAALALRIVLFGEVGDDAGDESFERLAPAELLGIERAVAADDPAVVADLGRPQRIGTFGRLRFSEQGFDLGHGGDKPFTLF